MRLSRLVASSVLVGAAALGAVIAPRAANAQSGFISSFNDISTVASTVPHNGDVNPYGVAVVQSSIGRLHQGDVLVSNFNDKGNNQGTGTTIVEISRSGQQKVFARIPQLPGGTGLTTALAILPRGFVIVGSLPTTDGTSATATRGALVLVNDSGRVVATISGGDINGPWDLTSFNQGDQAVLFFTNVLNGTVKANGKVVDRGTVVRMVLDLGGRSPQIISNTIIGSGFPERTDPAALVVGPTGVGLSPSGTLYVADTVDSSIQAIPNALKRHHTAGEGTTVFSGLPLNGPLGLAVAPNGDILTVNGLDGNIVETSPAGMVVATHQLDNSGSPPGSGALFGLAVVPSGNGVYFVDDAANTLMLLSP